MLKEIVSIKSKNIKVYLKTTLREELNKIYKLNEDIAILNLNKIRVISRFDFQDKYN